jgi:hypothetical protein
MMKCQLLNLKICQNHYLELTDHCTLVIVRGYKRNDLDLRHQTLGDEPPLIVVLTSLFLCCIPLTAAWIFAVRFAVCSDNA